ncbi:hypothetical protein K0M31_004606 [Melipona bicolor]|uniref:Uncharacterized protein n=1 Tax=Melipona bicolor TaxID=60889 RepID=A0AA40FXK5_9HYME|nr:hypothetical protein K0M31_004606 [Melipona bicolor]
MDLRAAGGWLKPYYGTIGVRFHLTVPMPVTQPWTAHGEPLWPPSSRISHSARLLAGSSRCTRKLELSALPAGSISRIVTENRADLKRTKRTNRRQDE